MASTKKPAAKPAAKKPAAKPAAKLYDVRLRAGFPASRRVRAGIEIPARTGLQTELTDEQLKALQADPEITVREAKTAKQMVDKQDAKEA